MAAMALIDALRDLENLPESHIPALNEIQQVVGKLAAFVEHGDGLFKAAEEGAKEVDDLLAQPADVPTASSPADTPATASGDPGAAPAAAAPAPAAAASSEDKDAEIAALRQQLALAQANAQRTQVETSADPATASQETPS